MDDIIAALRDKDDKKAYAFSKELMAESASSDKYYVMFDEFLALISDGSSYVRTRGLALCCAQARWDTRGKIAASLHAMGALLHDDKPTAVRQALAALHEVALYRPELASAIEAELDTMDTSKYKDSVAPLIEKDVAALRKMTE